MENTVINKLQMQKYAISRLEVSILLNLYSVKIIFTFIVISHRNTARITRKMKN